MRKAQQRSGGMLHCCMQRLCDPSDITAATLVALGLLTVEAALCPLIIWAVPCELVESSCWRSSVPHTVLHRLPMWMSMAMVPMQSIDPALCACRHRN